MSENKPLNVNDPDHVDEVMEELWQIRRELSDRFNGDMKAMGRYFQEQQRLHPERVYTASTQDLKTKGPASEPDAA
ncbi:MAG TPA: hypothetical protein VF647_13160 [Longimicrobium sp.]|jgi:hypothetical protein